MRYPGLISAHFYSLSKVDPGGGAGAQSCRLVCTQGAWKGPYCSPSPSHNIRGSQHCSTAETINIIISCMQEPLTRPAAQWRPQRISRSDWVTLF